MRLKYSKMLVYLIILISLTLAFIFSYVKPGTF